MSRLLTHLTVSALVFALVLVLAIAFGGPVPAPPRAASASPLASIDFGDLPSVRRFAASDGEMLAYRLYPATGKQAAGSVVLVHGASASSRSMHALAKAFAAAGFTAYAIDVRGHGASGSRGHIGYIGQLDRDLEDFVAQVRPPAPATLVGFSAGGGFALRVAGGARQRSFDSYLLLAPFIGQDAPTHRKSVGGLVSIGLPRLIAIHILDAMGVRVFNDLVVTRYPTSDSAHSESTSAYSFALATSFRPPRDYAATIRAARQPVELIVGDADEAFDAAAYEPMLRELGQAWPVTRLPTIGHLPLTVDGRAVAVIVEAAIRLQSAEASGQAERSGVNGPWLAPFSAWRS